MEEIAASSIYGKCHKKSIILNSINNLIHLASFGDVLALMTPQEDTAKLIAAKLKGLENEKEINKAMADSF